MAGEEKAEAKNLTAAIIVIGDEILKGHVQDANSHFLTKGLWELGVKVSRVVVVPDDLDTIAEEVRTLSPRYDFVLTSGGVGPTHDDVTMEAVGRAFSDKIIPHPDILRFLFPNDPNSPSHLSNPWRKMALVPESTKVHVMRPDDTFLLMAVHNVHCYPGVPSLLKQLFNKCKDLYRGSGRFFLKEVFFSCDEDVLAQPLTRVQKDCPSVQLGSYPDVSPENSYHVRVALESKDVMMVEKAYSQLALSLSISVMMSSKNNYSHLDSAMTEKRALVEKTLSLSAAKASLLPDSLCSRIHNSLQALGKALDEYSLSGICVAFNGGKDCTVILALLRALLTERGYSKAESKIHVLYVVESQQFPEVEQFIESTVDHVGLEVIRIPGGIKQALSALKGSHPQLKAVCMGTRRTDPHSTDLEVFSVTDKSWPEYMRVNSVLEWTYREVWLFLRLCEIPYCSLYEKGYTSLDGMADTHPNPSLLITSPSPTNTQSVGHAPSPILGAYLPAYMLADEGLERVGRTARSANL